ncbi:hypothetical protein MKW92_017051 [Papaver armeniacum]|nr:hypothetical protein MKW92_017051 [Papaver armeniacum]
MGVISKTEVNLRRLLATAPQQKNLAKLIHYVATLREQMEQLAAETTEDGLQRISKAKVSDYSEKIEALAAALAAEPPVSLESLEAFGGDWVKEIPSMPEQGTRIPSPRLSHYKVEDRSHEIKESDSSAPIKLDAEAHVLDSTERAVEHSLASTGNANAQAMEIYSRTFNTTCFTWLIFFVMICVFIMVILLIRVT